MKSYASIAIVKSIDDEKVAIEVVSVNLDGCDLAGAWVLKTDDLATIKQVLIERLLIFLDSNDEILDKLEDFHKYQVNFDDFISEAKEDAESAQDLYKSYMKQNEEDYRAYMAIKPNERKLIPKVAKKQLIAPEFKSWPDFFDISNPKDFLLSRRKNGLIATESNEMSEVLLAAKATKFLIDQWREDEIERTHRQYVSGDNAAISILPKCWLGKI